MENLEVILCNNLRVANITDTQIQRQKKGKICIWAV